MDPPTNLGAIAHDLGVRVVREQLVGSGYTIHPFEDHYEIMVNGDDPVGRQNFTLAHELGHFYIDRVVTAVKEGMWRRGPPPAVLEVDQREVERWCDKFASNVLLPRNLLLAHMGNFQGLMSAQRIQAGRPRFGVSVEPFVFALQEKFRPVVLCRVFSVENPLVEEFRPLGLASPELAAAAEQALRQSVGRGNVAPPFVGGSSLRWRGREFAVIGYVA